MRVLPGLTALVLAIGLAESATAGPITLNGITFSDESGGFVILKGWGSGRLDDPFVLVEDITDTGPAIVTIRGLSSGFSNKIGSHHVAGFALTKIVRNRTAGIWPSFSLELREVVDYGSPNEDGLSFGQATTIGRPFLSDEFLATKQIDEPFDGVSFFDGAVHPGGTVVLSVVVTDFTPKAVFYLVQRRDIPMAGLPMGPPHRRSLTDFHTAANSRAASDSAGPMHFHKTAQRGSGSLARKSLAQGFRN